MEATLKIGGFSGSFFDSAKVLNAMDKANRKALSKAGAFVRQNARGKLRYVPVGRPSKPGQPPFVHRGQKKTSGKAGKISVRFISPLKELLFFAYDERAKSVVIGPMQFGRAIVPVPTVLEQGGYVLTGRKGRRVRVKQDARPFMGPALREETPKIPGFFANSFR